MHFKIVFPLSFGYTSPDFDLDRLRLITGLNERLKFLESKTKWHFEISSSRTTSNNWYGESVWQKDGRLLYRLSDQQFPIFVYYDPFFITEFILLDITEILESWIKEMGVGHQEIIYLPAQMHLL